MIDQDEGAVHVVRMFGDYLRKRGGPLARLPADHALRIFAREWYRPTRGDKTIGQVADEIDAMLERAVNDEPPRLKAVQ